MNEKDFEKSLFDFQKDIQISLDNFKENTNMSLGEIFPLACQVFFTFPYTWLIAGGKKELFKDTMIKEIDIFLNSVEKD